MDDATLIELVQEFEVLYNRRHRDFKNRLVRENAWQAIADILNDTPENVENRWTSLRNRYAAELRKTKAVPSGAGAQPERIYMKAMNFFADYIIPRRCTVSNVKVQSSALSAAWSDVRDSTKTITEPSDWDDVAAGSSQTSTTEYEAETEERVPSTATAHQSIPSTSTAAQGRKREATPLRTKAATQSQSTEVDELLSSAIKSANEILTKEDDEDTTFGISLGKTLATIKCPKQKMKAKIALMQTLEKFIE